MQQAWMVAVKEFKATFKDKIFLVITGIFLLLSILSVYIGSSTQHAELRAYADIVKLLKSQGAAALPPKPEFFPLAILKNIIEYIGMVGAVLAIFLGFPAFSGEKEQGTLKLLLSRPLYRDQLLTGKLLGGALVIGFLLIITFVFNTILFTLLSGLSPNLAELARLAVFMALAFCYMMSFYTATVFVSIKSTDSTLVFLVMLILWVGVSYVIPQLAASQKAFAYSLNATAQTMTQVPTDTAVSRAIEIFSPTVHLQNLGGDLLQTVTATASCGIDQILIGRLMDLVYMLAPGLLLLFCSYTAFLKGRD